MPTDQITSGLIHSKIETRLYNAFSFIYNIKPLGQKPVFQWLYRTNYILTRLIR